MGNSISTGFTQKTEFQAPNNDTTFNGSVDIADWNGNSNINFGILQNNLKFYMNDAYKGYILKFVNNLTWSKANYLFNLIKLNLPLFNVSYNGQLTYLAVNATDIYSHFVTINEVINYSKQNYPTEIINQDINDVQTALNSYIDFYSNTAPVMTNGVAPVAPEPTRPNATKPIITTPNATTPGQTTFNPITPRITTPFTTTPMGTTLITPPRITNDYTKTYDYFITAYRLLSTNPKYLEFLINDDNFTYEYTINFLNYWFSENEDSYANFRNEFLYYLKECIDYALDPNNNFNITNSEINNIKILVDKTYEYIDNLSEGREIFPAESIYTLPNNIISVAISNTPRKTTPNATTPDQTTFNPTTPGQTTFNPTTPGQTTFYPTTPGQTTFYPTTPGQTTLNPTTPNATTPGQTTFNPTTPNRTTPISTTPGQTTFYPTTPMITTPNATTPNNPTTPVYTTFNPTSVITTPNANTPEITTSSQTSTLKKSPSPRLTITPQQQTSAPKLTDPRLDMSIYQNNINALISRYSPYASSSQDSALSIANMTMGPQKYPEINKILEERDTTDARRTHLEESVRKWNESMNRILLYVTVAIFACLLLLIIYNYLYLPTIIFVLAVVAVIATAAIFSVRQYFDSINRWNMDYDVYNYSPPVLDTTDLNQEVPESNIGSSLFSGWCMDSTCCSAGTIWDPASGQCSVVLPMTPRR
jgi:hypothetical protein